MMSYPKILFLDIDGVLNSEQSAVYYNRLGRDNGGLTEKACPIAQSNLHSILEEFPDLMIVVSSTWRLGETLDSMRVVLEKFADIPQARIVGLTPVGRKNGQNVTDFNAKRGHEIDEWLSGYDVERFVIVDDDSDMVHLSDFLVQTSWRHGLMRKDANKIMDMFMKPWKFAQGIHLHDLKKKNAVDTHVLWQEPDRVITFWGKGPALEKDFMSLEDWALAKTVEITTPEKVVHRTFIKSFNKPST